MAIEQNLARGMGEREARRAAHRDLGGVAAVKEARRQADSLYWLDTLLQDLRYGVRILRRSPRFAVAVVLILGLGVAVTTTVFGIVHGVLLRPLAYPNPGAIVRIGEGLGSVGGSDMWLSNRSMPLLEENAESFEQLAGYLEISARWASLDGATLSGARVTPSLFPLLGARPRLGRLFTEEEGREGASPAVLLSHGLWTARFGSDADVVETLVDLDGEPHTVVGVLPDGFDFPNAANEFWTPLAVPAFAPPSGDDPTELRTIVSLVFGGLGRLRPGVLARAGRHGSAHHPAGEQRRHRAAVRRGSSIRRRARGRCPRGAAAGGHGRRVPARVADADRGLGSRPVDRLHQRGGAASRAWSHAPTDVRRVRRARRGQRPARAPAPDRERGVEPSRAAFSAWPPRRLRCAWCPRSFRVTVARLDEVGIDTVTVAFTVCLSVSVGLLSGAVPALQWSRLDPVRTLNEGSARSAGGFRLLRSNRSRAVLVTAQVALALVLLIGTGLLLRSFVALVTFDRGYEPANVVSTRAVFPFSSQPSMAPGAPANSQDRYGRLHERLLDEMTARLEALPDVEAFGLSRSLPFESDWDRTSETLFRVVGTPTPSNWNEQPRPKVRIVSRGYLEAMRFRLHDGRTFTRLDGSASPRVMVANETLARELFGSGPAVGRRVVSPFGEPWEVVGVVGDVVYAGLELTAEPQAEAFFPLAQVRGERGFGFSSAIYVAVRTTGGSLAVVPFLREAVTATDPQARLGTVMTMEARLSTAVAEPRFYAVFVGSFAGFALLLAALGIFGLLSYTVAQREGEIGIRMALGARRGDILALVTRQAAMLVAVGAGVGLAGAGASSRFLESLLHGVAADDPLTFAAAPLVLVTVALVACWLPARQATRVDPIKAMRVE